MAFPPGMLPLVSGYLCLALIGSISCDHHWEGSCLQDGRHKATPTPEPLLKECRIYSENSCCSEEQVEDLVTPPGGKTPAWDKCGPISPTCEGYLKRVACFHRCSPDAALWPHPQQLTALHGVPLCHSFCRDWYTACKTEMTCARNWASDPRGQNCTGSCVTFQQMYQHGRDLCESLWGEAFIMTAEEEEEEGEGRPCGCLTLSPSDREVMAALRAHGAEPDELDTTKSGLPQYRAPCAPRRSALPPLVKRGKGKGNGGLRKRSVLADDGEGSGSGM